MTNLATIRDFAITTTAGTLTACLVYALTTAHKEIAESADRQDAWNSQHAEEHAELMENYQIQRAQARAEHLAIMAQITSTA
ncbi:hypothetical protein [Mycobacteroides chelonae]|uniref:Uncharacterized protein n=1 Tax=Mycobacteroides chelonae TaxID=1774 RepID=A0A1S1M028_MYCCH|nr:hypothetical protein [Mycobacteroides chelonae]OHU76047.1 hypothetical protein BKG84_24435 [Mycobacteroides chelonae]